MTLRFAWVLNLDAELELVRPGYNRTLKLANALEQSLEGARPLLGAQDVLVEPGVHLEPGFRGRAWCPTKTALSQLTQAGAVPEAHPDVSVLRQVNHRRFGWELGGGAPGSEYVETRAELERIVRSAQRTWLLKRPLSFAGRGQRRVSGELSPPDWSFIEASLADDGLLIEPLLELTAEFSIHGFIWPDWRYEIGAACLQTIGGRGAWQSSRRATTNDLQPSELKQLQHQAARAADALTRANYFGPFGIDAYRYKLGADTGFCALGELNARYTMGFVVGFPRHPSEICLA